MKSHLNFECWRQSDKKEELKEELCSVDEVVEVWAALTAEIYIMVTCAIIVET